MARGRAAANRGQGEKGRRQDIKRENRRKDARRAELFKQPAVIAPMPRPQAKRPSKREKMRRMRDVVDIPGLQHAVSEKARALRVGFGILQFLSPYNAQGSASDLSSEDESLNGDSSPSVNGLSASMPKEHEVANGGATIRGDTKDGSADQDNDEANNKDKEIDEHKDSDGNKDLDGSQDNDEDKELDQSQASSGDQIDAEDTPGSSGSEAGVSAPTPVAVEEDFISLDFSSDEEDEAVSSGRTNGISMKNVEADRKSPWWPPQKEERPPGKDSDDSEDDEDSHLGTEGMSGPEQIGEELLEYLRYVSPQRTEASKREATIGRLRRVVNQLWRSATVSVFGSHATGMYLPDADIDVVILSDELRAKIRQEMHRLAARLKSNRLTDSVQVISHARVPIVKYVEAGSRTNVDIAFGQTGGLDTARLVTAWLSEFPVLKPMGMFVRQFLKQRKLSDVANGGLGGYAMICMMYSRLRFVLAEFPSVFEAGNSKEENAVTVLRNGGLLLLDFFDYYGNVFDNSLMAVRCTAPFTPFYKRVNGDMHTPQPAGLAIEDPQNRQNNISKASYNYPTVKRSFQNAADMLKSLLVNREHAVNGVDAPPESLLGHLLKFRGNEPLRKKVSLDVALSVPDLAEPGGDAEVEQSISDVPTRKERRFEKKREQRQLRKDQRLSKQTAKNNAAKNNVPARPPKPEPRRADTPRRADKGGTVKPDHSAALGSRKRTSADFDPWDSGTQAKAQDSDPEPEPRGQSKRGRDDEDGENDEADSRVKLTTAERRQFWRDKAGTPEPSTAPRQ